MKKFSSFPTLYLKNYNYTIPQPALAYEKLKYNEKLVEIQFK